jgi:hypothetical protein
MRSYKGGLFNNDLASPPRMRDEHGSNTNLHIVADLNAFRKFVIDEDIISNENIGAYSHPTSTVERRAQRRGPGTESRHDVKDSITSSSKK